MIVESDVSPTSRDPIRHPAIRPDNQSRRLGARGGARRQERNSRMVISLDPLIVAALRRYVAIVNEEGRAWGESYSQGTGQ
jgi:hypothetical protein